MIRIIDTRLSAISMVVLLAYNVAASPTPLLDSLAEIEIITREVPGINDLILCDGPNITGQCFTEPITPATLGNCIDFSGENAFLAGELRTIVCPQGFECILHTAHNCFTATDFGIGPGTVNLMQPFQGLVNSASVMN